MKYYATLTIYKNYKKNDHIIILEMLITNRNKANFSDFFPLYLNPPDSKTIIYL